MNKIYKLKFNRETQDLVAVSELATNAVAGSATQDADATPAPTLTSKLAAFTNRVRNWGMVTGAMLACGLALSVPAQALSGAQVVAGTATIATEGSVTTITNSPNTIINWQQFNIGKNELVQFIQESSNSAVLNRVLGNEVSEILGTLKSNGKVFLINPNGILFGANAVVDTSALVASTLNMSDADFQAGKYVFNQEKDRAIASVLNQGVIKVQNDGTLALVGGNVVNTGILEAKNGSVYLLAGQSIQIADLNNPLISFKVTAGNKAVNLGEIVARNVALLGNGVNHGRDTVGQAFVDLYTSGSATTSRITTTGDVLLYAGSESQQLQSTDQINAQVTGERNGLAVVNGVIDVANAQGQAGSVQVLADTLHVGAQAVVDATGRVGGSVQLGGDRQGTGNLKLSQSTQVEAGASVDVSGTHQAGSAVVWGDRAEVSGKYRATSVHGNGGLIETSGKYLHVAESIQVNTTSFNGERGNWLLDPEHLVILGVPVGGTTPIRGSPGEVQEDTPSTGGKSYGASSSTTPIESIYNTTIEKALESSDVTLHATSCISGQQFTILSRDTSKKLTLDAPNVVFTDVEFTVGKIALIGKSQGVVNFLNTTFTSEELNIDSMGTVSITDGGKLMANNLQVTSQQGEVRVERTDLHGDSVTVKGKTRTFLHDLELNTRHSLTLESEEGRVQADFIRNSGIHGDVTLSGKQGVMLADTYLGTDKDSSSSSNPVDSITITSAAGDVQLSNLKLNSTGAITVKGQQGVRGTNAEVEDAKTLELSSEEASVSLTGRSLKSTESLTVKGKTEVTLNGLIVTAKDMTVESATTTLVGTTLKEEDAAGSLELKGSEKLVVNGGSITTSGRTELKSDAGSVELTKAQISSTATSGVSVAAQTNVIIQQQSQVQANTFKVKANDEIAIRGSEVVAKEVELSEASSPTKVVTLDGATLLAGMTKEQFEQFSIDTQGLTPDTSAWVKAYGQQITLRDAKVGAAGEVDFVGDGGIGVSAGTIVGNKARLYATMGDLRVTGGTITAKDENRVESKHGRVDLENNLMKGKTALVVGNMSLTLTGSQLTADETVSVSNGKEGDVELTKVNAKTTSGDICVSATNGHVKVLTGTTLESGADVKLEMVDGSQGDILVQGTVTSAKDVVVTNKNGTTFENAQVTATGSVKALDGKAVTISNSQVQGTAGVTVTADKVEVTKQATVDSSTGTTDLTGKTALTVSDGATVSAAMNTQLGGGAITVTDASLKGNNLFVTGTEAVAVRNTDLKANNEFRAEGKTVELTHITATEGVEHLTASGTDSLTVADTELTTGTMAFESSAGTVQVNNSTLAGRMSFSIEGKGNVDIAQGSKLSSTSLTGLRIESKGETVTISDSQVDAHAQLTIKGNWGTSLRNSKVEAGVLELQKDSGTITISGGVVKTRNSDLVLNTTDHISIRDNAQVISSNNLNIHSTNDGVSMDGAVISAQEKASVTSSSTIDLESTSISAQEVSVTSEAGARINNLDLESTVGKTKLTTENDMMLEGSNSFTAGEGEDILVTAVNGRVDVFGAELQGNHATFTGGTGVGLNGVSGTLKGDLEVEALKNNVSLSQSQVTAHNVALQGENFEIRNSEFTVTNEFNATAASKGKVVLSNTTVHATTTDDSQVVLGTDLATLILDQGTNLEASKAVSLTAIDRLELNNATVSSRLGSVEVNAGKASLTQATLTGAQQVSVVSTDSTGMTLQDTNLNSGSAITVSNNHGVQITSSNLNATKAVSVTAADAMAVLDGVVVTTENATVSAHHVEAANLHAQTTDLTLQADNMMLRNSEVTSSNSTKVEVVNNVTIDNTNFTAPVVNVSSTVEGYVVVGDSHLDTDDLTLKATDGYVNLGNSFMNVTKALVEGTGAVTLTENTVRVADKLTLSSEEKIDTSYNKGRGKTLELIYPVDSESRAYRNSWVWDERINPLEEEEFIDLSIVDVTTAANENKLPELDLENTPPTGWEDLRARNHSMTVDRNEFAPLLANPTQVELSADGQGAQVATVPVKLTLATCSLLGETVIKLHHITEADLRGLAPLELQRKYNLTAQELEVLVNSCK